MTEIVEKNSKNDPEVVEKATRRRFTTEYKRRIALEAVSYPPPGDTTYRRQLRTSKSEEPQREIVYLYGTEGLSFPLIARRLEVSTSLVSRAYSTDYSQETMDLAETGKSSRIRAPKRKPSQTHSEIDRLLQETDLSYGDICRRVDADKWTVRNNRNRSLAEGKHVPLRPKETRRQIEEVYSIG